MRLGEPGCFGTVARHEGEIGDSPLSAQIADVNLPDGEKYRGSGTQRVVKSVNMNEGLPMRTLGILPACFEIGGERDGRSRQSQGATPDSEPAVNVLSHRR
jgi:hypothetical protein